MYARTATSGLTSFVTHIFHITLTQIPARAYSEWDWYPSWNKTSFNMRSQSIQDKSRWLNQWDVRANLTVWSQHTTQTPNGIFRSADDTSALALDIMPHVININGAERAPFIKVFSWIITRSLLTYYWDWCSKHIVADISIPLCNYLWSITKMNYLFKCSDISANLLDNNVIKWIFMAIQTVVVATRVPARRAYTNMYTMW